MVVSPTGNPKGSAIGAQNCAVLAVPSKRNRPSSKSVQASLPPRPPGLPLPSTKRQAKSLMASAMGCVSAKLSEAGTPPMNGNISSQTSGVGFSPSGSSTMTSRSGRTAGSEGSQLKAFRPTGRRLGPGSPLITMVKRNPTGRSKIGTPSLNCKRIDQVVIRTRDPNKTDAGAGARRFCRRQRDRRRQGDRRCSREHRRPDAGACSGRRSSLRTRAPRSSRRTGTGLRSRRRASASGRSRSREGPSHSRRTGRSWCPRTGRCSVPERVRVGVCVRVGVAPPVCVNDGAGVSGAVAVWVTVTVAVPVRVAVRVAVLVGAMVGRGPVPTLTSIWATRPVFPSTSRICALTRVIPSGNASTVEMGRQNCSCVLGSTKAWTPNSLSVHDAAGFDATENRHPISFKASAMDWSGPKFGGEMPGMPHPPWSQTRTLPLPRSRDALTCSSGRALGSSRLKSRSCSPIAAPEGPRMASSTTRNPTPPGNWYVGTGSDRIGADCLPSAETMPTKVMIGPVAMTCVPPPWRKATMAETSAAVTIASPLASAPVQLKTVPPVRRSQRHPELTRAPRRAPCPIGLRWPRKIGWVFKVYSPD